MPRQRQDTQPADALFEGLSFLPTDTEKLQKPKRICPEPNSALDAKFDVCMPHFIIFGGMKCGTTSLWEYLGEHPDILHVKDDHHFFPQRIRDQIEQQIALLKKVQKEKKWLYRDFSHRNNLSEDQRALLPKNLLPSKARLTKEASKIRRSLGKLLRPIIGSKEVRWFGPTHFKWATYFASSFVEPLRWYVNSFPTIPKFHGTEFEENYGKITGEASPTYLHGNKDVIERVKYILPDVRLIILLRDPVDRFLSMQRMKVGMADAVAAVREAEGKKRRKEGLSLDELIEISNAGPYQSPDLGTGDKAKLRKVNKDLLGSRYYQKIMEVLTTMDPDQVLVIQSEYFYKHTVEVMYEIETFLGISHMGADEWGSITSHVYNLVMDGKNRTFTPNEGKQNQTAFQISDQTRKLLEEYFMYSNEQLAEVLEMRFEGWNYPTKEQLAQEADRKPMKHSDKPIKHFDIDEDPIDLPNGLSIHPAKKRGKGSGKPRPGLRIGGVPIDLD